MPLDIVIMTGSTVPIYRQIADQVCRAVATGKLVPGEQVPSVRALAEELVINPKSGEVDAILVRHGRADYLVRVPARFVRTVSPSRAEVDDSAELDAMERIAVTSGRTPPTGEHMEDAKATEPAGKPEDVVGSTDGMPDSYDGPATG